jgi:hypothetical protein
MIISISPNVIHHDPRWYPEPDAFRPERFSKENEKLLPKYAYLPFSSGHPVVPQATLTLRPKHGLKMALEPRSLEAESPRVGQNAAG